MSSSVDAEKNLPPKAVNQQPIEEKPTTRHILYLLFLKVIGAAILNGAINFGIAAAMYSNVYPVQVWKFPNTLAGDAAVTVFVQGILTWILDGMLTSKDVRTNAKPFRISPLRPPRWIREGPAPIQWFFGANLDLLERGIGAGERGRRFFGSFVRSIIYCIPVFLISWPIGVGILAGTAGDDGIVRGFPTAAFFKLAFGGGMGLWQTFIVSLTAMWRKGWPEKDVEEANKRAQRAQKKAAADSGAPPPRV
eukprot:TRINITY_DN1451_c0_g1_i1.p1 TRINITY_DN1451_c0_g1~~TRINITY_DN1451_c0_g1_i1.p1  ORF type:complete len:250 (-),score=103.74 TRINITY_DN1451_c0_g1_i1:108-857(-)